MQVPILFNLSDNQLLELASRLEPRTVQPGEVVIKEGEEGDTFFIIEDGTFCCYLNDGTKLALIDRGSCFGELALLHNDRRKCNVAAEGTGGAPPLLQRRRASAPLPMRGSRACLPLQMLRQALALRSPFCSCAMLRRWRGGACVTLRRRARAGKLLCLNRTDFTEHLGDLQQLRHTWRFEALRRVPLLQQLSHAARGQLCNILEQVVLPKKTRVVNQGEPGDAFYIVETGVLAVVKDGKPIMRLSPGQVRSAAAVCAVRPHPACARRAGAVSCTHGSAVLNAGCGRRPSRGSSACT